MGGVGVGGGVVQDNAGCTVDDVGGAGGGQVDAVGGELEDGGHDADE